MKKFVLHRYLSEDITGFYLGTQLVHILGTSYQYVMYVNEDGNIRNVQIHPDDKIEFI